MAKEKVTLTLDAGNVAELRTMVGPRGLSAVIDDAVVAHLQRLRHLAAVDEWLGEMDGAHGPVPAETLQWASRTIDEWNSKHQPRSSRRAS
jgi:hypothetical protein